MKVKRVPTRVRTRKLDRAVAKERMKKAGYCHVNRRYGGKSFVQLHWRDFSEYGRII